MENQEPISDTVANMLSQQVTHVHWLPLVANSHTSAPLSDTAPNQSKISAYADLQNSLEIELSSVSRCTYFRPVSSRPSANSTYRSSVFAQIAYPYLYNRFGYVVI